MKLQENGIVRPAAVDRYTKLAFASDPMTRLAAMQQTDYKTTTNGLRN